MKRILLVEDTPHLSEEIADILRMEGYQVTVVNNGLEALALLSEAKPDLIITDLLMPKMDGYEFVREIRSMTPFGSIPIVILSARTSAADKTHGMEVGANAFIQKPCKAHELVTSIKSLLR
jgi:DNA-binding response OmpR family regulator